MNKNELAVYARKKGLYVKQIKAWKDACMNAKETARYNRKLNASEKERKNSRKKFNAKRSYQLKGFATIEEARAWYAKFVKWYRFEHHHSGIQFLTAAERHAGKSDKILSKRYEVYMKLLKLLIQNVGMVEKRVTGAVSQKSIWI